MQERRRCYLLLSIFLLSLVFPAVSSTSDSRGIPAAVDALDSNWQSIEPTSTTMVELKEMQPTIHLAGFSFDPLVSDFDDINSAWKNSGSLYLLQLSTNDGSIIEQLSTTFEFKVLERQSPGVYIVRMHDAMYLESLFLHDDVRWVGEYSPFMRTTSDVLESKRVHYVLASDVDSFELAGLSADFIRNGASTAWCSMDMCEAVYDDGITPMQLQMSASHDDVLFVQEAFDLMLHNNMAAMEVGAVAVRASSSLGLNGSGETIAVMDLSLIHI